MHDRSPGRHTPAAQYNLGIMYDNGTGIGQDYKEAIKWYTIAATQGHADAQYNLGFMYAKGQGVKQDYKGAVEWYRKAAEQEFTKAQFNLGFMHSNGRGVKQDFVEVLKWLQLAAEQGFKDALNALDSMQQHNLVPKPPKAAKLNNKTGTVVEAPSADMVRPGLAFVRLYGEVKPRMFKNMNLRIKTLL